jgi:hypothetical protein
MRELEHAVGPGIETGSEDHEGPRTGSRRVAYRIVDAAGTAQQRTPDAWCATVDESGERSAADLALDERSHRPREQINEEGILEEPLIGGLERLHRPHARGAVRRAPGDPCGRSDLANVCLTPRRVADVHHGILLLAPEHLILRS